MAVTQSRMAITLPDGAINLTNVITFNCLLNSACIDQNVWIANGSYVVTGIQYNHGTAGNDASAVTLDVKKCTGTTAPASGTSLLDSAFNCKATANTIQTGTVVSSEATRTLTTGDRLALDFTGTVTSLANVTVAVSLRRV